MEALGVLHHNVHGAVRQDMFRMGRNVLKMVQPQRNVLNFLTEKLQVIKKVYIQSVVLKW